MKAASSFFVDSNVLVYSVDVDDAVRCEAVWTWLLPLWERQIRRLSWQVLHEFDAVATRKRELLSEPIRRAIRDYGSWKPVDTSRGLVERAWHWIDTAEVTYRDGLILAAAEQSGAGRLLTEDLQPGQEFGGARVVNPFQSSPADFDLAPLKLMPPASAG